MQGLMEERVGQTLHAARAEAVFHRTDKSLPQPRQQANSVFDKTQESMVLISSGGLARLGRRMEVSVVGDIRGGYRHPGADRRIEGFMIQVRQDLLKTKVGRFLEHQLVGLEKTRFYLQDYKPGALVLVLNPETILDMPGLRNCTEISQLVRQISCHLIPLFELKTVFRLIAAGRANHRLP